MIQDADGAVVSGNELNSPDDGTALWIVDSSDVDVSKNQVVSAGGGIELGGVSDALINKNDITGVDDPEEPAIFIGCDSSATVRGNNTITGYVDDVVSEDCP